MKPSSDTNEERNDPVWEALNSSPMPKAGPSFVRNTVRRVRCLEEDSQDSNWLHSVLRSFFSRPAPVLATGFAAVAILVTVAVTQNNSSSSTDIAAVGEGNGIATPVPDSPAVIDDPAPVPAVDNSLAGQLEQIDYLDDLVAVTDPGSLDQQMLADLLY